MVKIVTFDIWDTILKRKCHPEEIKLATCKYITYKYKNKIKKEYKTIYDILKLRNKIEWDLGIENEKKGFDREYIISDVFKKLNLQLFDTIVNNFEDELLSFELSHEKKMSFVNSEIYELINKYSGCDLYCISDFYMSSKQLKELFKEKGILKYFKEIYSSADFLLNKRSGNLFNKFKNDLNIDYNSILHIGDNAVADIEIPANLGINTYKIENNSNYLNIPNRKLNYNKILGLSKQKNLYNIGKELSIIPYYFVLKILTQELSNNTKTIYYFTREGEFFSKVHQIINHNNFYNTKSCNEKILEVSRMATFCPSLKEFSIKELMNIWKQYNKQSVKTLYLSLNIDINKYLDFFEKYSIDINEFINEPWKDKKIKKLFSDNEFIFKMRNEIKDRKDGLLKYFKNKSIDNDNREIVVVDIGWRGTIQDNIAKIFNNKHIRGYYLSILKYFNVQPKNVEKISIIEETEFINKYIGGLITFFEMLFIPETGSVVDYTDGKANRKILENEYKMIKEYITEIQRGMLDGVKVLDEYFAIHPYDISQLYNLFKEKIISVRTKPNKKLVDVYFKLVLNDTFGSGKYVEKNIKLNFFDKLNFKKCIILMRKESWKEAFLVHNNLKMLSFIIKLKKILKRQ